MKVILIIGSFFVCHYLADFCLTNKAMIQAKADGRKLAPIGVHAAIHAILIALCAGFFAGIRMAVLALCIEWLTHFIIDTGKGRLMSRYPFFGDFYDKRYWILFGFDQMLHAFVLLFIISLII